MSVSIRVFISFYCFAAIGVPALANQHVAVRPASNLVIQDSGKSKTDLYGIFKKGQAGDGTARRAAYEAATEFLKRYPDEKDPRTAELKDWVARFEIELRGVDVLISVYRDKKYAEAFQLGKQVLGTDPDNIKVLTALGYAGMPAAATGNNELTAEAIVYARKAIQLIETGKTPADWKPFAGRDETLGWLNYSIGVMILKTMPKDAIVHLGRAARYDGAPKQDPRVYYYMAVLYGQDFDKQRAEYKASYEGKTETPESKAALAKVSAIVDLMIDSYARAIAYTNANPQLKQMFQQQESEWTTKITEFYKSRHDGSDAGLRELIADIRTKPLPGQPAPATSLTKP